MPPWGWGAAQTLEVAGWVESADPGTVVPTCPGWTLTDLTEHIGATQRWVGTMVAQGITDPAAAFSLDWGKLPAEPSAWSEWLSDGAHELRTTFAAATDERAVFDPSGEGDG